jgi:hypothetical protein
MDLSKQKHRRSKRKQTTKASTDAVPTRSFYAFGFCAVGVLASSSLHMSWEGYLPNAQSAQSKGIQHNETQAPSSCNATTVIFGENHFQFQSENIPFLHEMKQKNLTHSYRQQLKFSLVKEQVLQWVQTEQRQLWQTDGKHGRLHAFLLTDNYAFRHIFKCGGTTIENQGTRHVPSWRIGDRNIMAVVRDPIDHFLSGWAECAKRGHVVGSNQTYDEWIHDWLDSVRQKASSCAPHSFPQANFILSTNLTKLNLLGDLQELPQLVELVGFPFDETKELGRVAADDAEKVRFPKRKDLLSNATLVALCQFLAMDYYLFDFDVPDACRSVPFLDKWSSSPLGDC